jgi:S1-C subfamily serine protease
MKDRFRTPTPGGPARVAFSILLPPLLALSALVVAHGPVAAPLAAQEVRTGPPVRAAGASGWLGVRLVTHRAAPGTAHPLARRGSPVETPFQVQGVIPGGPADQAGIRDGDRLTRIGGETATPRLLARTLDRLQPGDTVRVTVERDGTEQEVTVIAGERPTYLADREGMQARMDSVRILLGTHLESLTSAMERLRAGEEIPGLRIMEDERGNLFVFGPDGTRHRLELDEEGRARRAVVLREMTEALAAHRGRLDSLPLSDPAELDSLVALIRGTDGEADRRVRVLVRERSPGAEREIQVLTDPEAVRRGPPGRIPTVGEGMVDGPPVVTGFRVVAGAELAPLNPGLASYFEVDRGVLVMNVLAGTPAAQSGLEAGDVITHVHGEEVNSTGEFRAALTRAYRSPPVRVRVVREGEERELIFSR